MSLLTLIKLVIVIQFVGASNVTILDATYGTGINLWESSANFLIHASVMHNNITENLLHDELKLGYLEEDLSKDNSHIFHVKHTNFEDAGEWQINSTLKINDIEFEKEKKLILRITKYKEKLLPDNHLIEEEGDYVQVHFENSFENVTSCQLISSDKSKKYELTNSKSDTVEGIEIYGKCGFRMRANSSWPNKWTLRQENENYGVMIASFEVHYGPRIPIPEKKYKVWTYGSGQTLVKLDSDIYFCELEEPNGQVIRYSTDKCTYTIQKASNIHNGIWKLRYVPKNSKYPKYQEITVRVIESKEVDAVFGNNALIWESGYCDEIFWAEATRNNITYNLLHELKDVQMKYKREDGFSEFYLTNIGFDHSGEWRINSSIMQNGEEVIHHEVVYLRVTKHNEEILPTSYLIGEEGSYVTVHFQNYFDHITSCQLISSDKSRIFELSGSKNDTVEGLEIHKNCAIRMRLNSLWPSKWTLRQENNNYGAMTATFTAYGIPRYTVPEQRIENWKIGSVQRVIKLDSDVQFCELQLPNKQNISLHSHNCSYTVQQVKENHAGIWKVRYIPKYRTNIINQEIHVIIIDPRKVDWSVTKEKNGVLHLQCRTFLEEISYCLFTTPRGNIINVVTGMGNEKYEYYGTPHRPVRGQNYSQCGLTIHNPTTDDKGLWKCTIRSADSLSNTVSTYVSTNWHKEKDVGRLHIATHNITVVHDEDFIIKCITERSIDYCSMRSPDGTIYSVTKDRGDVPNHLPYTGEGLSVGDCGAYIEKANNTHNGNWACRLGVSSDDAELEAIVAVTVAETYVVPEKTPIHFNPQKKPELLVSVLPNRELTIKYCRWIHPNGQTLHKGNDSQYLRKQNATSCSVSLEGITPEDHQRDSGTWSCYVGFNAGPDNEAYTTIKYVYK